MKKVLIIAGICVIIAIIGYFLFGPEGGLLGALGLGAGISRGDKILEGQAEKLKDEIEDIDDKLLEPVEDLTDNEIEDYWNND